MGFAQQSQSHTPDQGGIPQEWALICQRLQAELGDATFRSWIAPLTLTNATSGMVQLAAPTRFMRDWVASNFLEKIRNYWQDINPTIDTIDLIVKAGTPVSVAQVAMADPMVVASGEEVDIEGSFIGSTLDPRFTFENFVVGKPNELAYAAALRVAESATVQFNPLFLYGGVGLGKTHLMHAIAWHIKKCHPNRRVIYLSAEKFMYQFIRALRYKDTVAFKEQFRSVDVLMIDDVQFISGKDTTQEEFFHTFNALVDRNHQVIVSADKSPSDLEGMEERLKSRLGWGLVADIHPTSYELRLGILQSKAETLNAVVPKDVLEFLAFKIASNVRELEGALNRIIAHSTLVGREINLEMTQDVLRDLLKANDRRVTIDDIQKRVCEYFSIKLSDMQSSRRSQNVARPRQIAMYLSKILTPRSLPDIGRKFGGRDHTTVLHAVKKVEELMGSDKEFLEDLTILRRTLEV
ncbi:MAG: chromosomal replication initiator protein DnaA [Candidatus Paracaedibacteraceae bacterium]|nr:chromosomal replication initiator protein DnaA [Candidatus Paracaedibacteraceae bacterium]